MIRKSTRIPLYLPSLLLIREVTVGSDKRNGASSQHRKRKNRSQQQVQKHTRRKSKNEE